MKYDLSEINYFSSGPRDKVLSLLISHGYKFKTIYVGPIEKFPKIKPTLKIAEKNNIPIEVIDSKKKLESISDDISDSFCLSVGFHYLFSPLFLTKIKICINVHGSLLPFYSGARTLNWVIENGETESGVTVHIVDEGMDTGDIILQKSFPLSKFDTGESLYAKTLDFEPKVVLEALELLKNGNVKSKKQPKLSSLSSNDRKKTKLENRKPSHSELNPSDSLEKLYNKIRASHPINYPAYFFVDGKKVLLKMEREDRNENDPYDDLMI